MRREQRLRRRKDFAEAYRHGRVHGNHLLVVRVRPNGGLPARFGVVAGKAVGGAVVRNRVKRRLRAAVDSLAVHEGVDVVIGSRAKAAEASYGELRAALGQLLRRAGVVPEPGSAAKG